ncbi:MAG TPA: hypothetical protein DG761_06990 [Gammaproteobacteria bacterium]|mgnify:CR=1 FL=1|nr:hypothetical protein [Acidiferrobacteraceae bacterium]MDP6552216.1 hypothetical protein [Arenicellales bacterium]MDP6792001.1 hypothetical protein [Arenicellales bacterium]MDP6919999.1 hypothetical protein [Arenicellales bacterium]HCX87753.1 hypothetical protein [Gammaproteobacteria bacterium]
MTDSGRRAFFRAGTRKVAEAVVDQADAHARQRAKHWIRPPYALDELEFLTTCTRCGECVDACLYQVVFLLPPRLGAAVASTPALDLTNRGCHLCADWPCVTACEPRALKLPETTPDTAVPMPRVAIVNINPQACLPYLGPECGACAPSCPIPGALTWSAAKPVIDPGPCTGCGLCREACIVDPKAIEIKSLHRDAEQGNAPKRSFKL